MTDLPTYSLWLKPEGGINKKFSRLIKSLSDEYAGPSFDPHVTLLGGLKMEKETVIDKLQQIDFKPVEIHLDDVGCKDNFYQSLFVHVKNDEIYQLREQCDRIFSKSEEYMPHLSLMYNDIPIEEKETLATSVGNFSGTQFTARNIHVVSTGGKPEQWEEVFVYSL